jgi:hypothetical protein
MVPHSFNYDADKYEERLEGYPFSRRLRVLYHKPKNARQMGFAQFSIETNNQAPFLDGILQAGYALGGLARTRFFNAHKII